MIRLVFGKVTSEQAESEFKRVRVRMPGERPIKRTVRNCPKTVGKYVHFCYSFKQISKNISDVRGCSVLYMKGMVKPMPQ